MILRTSFRSPLFRRAFTSLELTIAMGIIALLAAILVPVADVPDAHCGPAAACSAD